MRYRRDNRVVQCNRVKCATCNMIHARDQHEENGGGHFNYKANGFMYANVRVSRRDADLITAAAPAARAHH